MIFRSNQGFVFHDSRGFEAGGVSELDNVKLFIKQRAKEKKLPDQIHAIWLVIHVIVILFPNNATSPSGIASQWTVQGPLPRQSKISFPRLELGKVRNSYLNDIYFAWATLGIVPVIVIFTKFDAQDDDAYEVLKEEGLSLEDARIQAPSRAMKDFQDNHKNLPIFKSHYPPKQYVILRGKSCIFVWYIIWIEIDMNLPESHCNELVKETAAALDHQVLQALFVSTQTHQIELCIQYAVQ